MNSNPVSSPFEISLTSYCNTTLTILWPQLFRWTSYKCFCSGLVLSVELVGSSQ